MSMVQEGDAVRTRLVVPGRHSISIPIHAVMARALEYESQRRYGTIVAFAEAFQQAVNLG